MGLISRVSSRTYRNLREMFLSATRSALGASLARQAGYTTYRTTMVEAVARAGRDHNDVKVIYGFCVLGSGLLFGIFYHSAKDPRYFFGTNRSNENYKKYMTKRQWCMETGRGPPILLWHQPIQRELQKVHDQATVVHGDRPRTPDTSLAPTDPTRTTKST